MANRLADETSPYLLQHANNPVDWFPWGEEALAKARDEDRPILLSVGYSACHWCHVMERESFENEAIAARMNRDFVNIKVDREERPDIDGIYMQAVQAMTGQGGWPMTVFLFPDGTPFYGGTYFPPEDRQGMPGFPRVLEAVAKAFRERREELREQGQGLVNHLSLAGVQVDASASLTDAPLRAAYDDLASRFDAELGGFGGAPKFPQPMQLDLLLRHHYRTGDAHALEMVEVTLRAMAFGGIYDQVSGGFHRYSTDARWLVPHFEKMLYDNAQLAATYIDAFLVTKTPLYRRIAAQTLDYVLREMTHPSGGFFSSQDADSEGVEGKFFTWTPAELAAALGDEDAEFARAFFGATEHGNFERSNILHIPAEPAAVASEHGMTEEDAWARIEDIRRRLYDSRELRVHPARDEKVLAAWNGMMLKAFARASRTIDEGGRYLAITRQNADFLLRELLVNGRLMRSWKDGRAHLLGYLEDYANVADGLLATYAATFDDRYLEAATDLARRMVDLFWDDTAGAFYDTGHDHEALVTRPRDFFDNATPAGTSVAVDALLHVAVYADDERLANTASRALLGMAPLMQRAPSAFGRLLGALDFHLARRQELAIVWPPDADAGAVLSVAFGDYRPNLLPAGGPRGGRIEDAVTPILQGREPLDGAATAFVCEHYACKMPTTDPNVLRAQLAGAGDA